MAFARLTYRESLRDIEVCLRGAKPKLYHMGIRGKVSRNTLAHANERRDERIFADFAQVLIKTARQLYAGEDFGLELDQTVYTFDPTTIALCLSAFPWAKFRKGKSAATLHSLLYLRGNIPVVIRITSGKIHHVNALDDFLLEAGCLYLRSGLCGFRTPLPASPGAGVLHHPRAEQFRLQALVLSPVDKSTGVRADQIITVTGLYTLKNYECDFSATPRSSVMSSD